MIEPQKRRPKNPSKSQKLRPKTPSSNLRNLDLKLHRCWFKFQIKASPGLKSFWDSEGVLGLSFWDTRKFSLESAEIADAICSLA